MSAVQQMQKEISIDLPSEKIALQGILTIPKNAKQLIMFAHGSGSGRHSPRNQFVANFLVKHSLATLLMDLLTPDEEILDNISRQYRFDIPLLAKRLVGATRWLRQNPSTERLKVGYFGASTGAAAALIAAAEAGNQVSAVVSRGGRPDLAAPILHKRLPPTLLIVGGDDTDVIELNRKAFALLLGEKELRIVPGATHLFEEPGTLEEAAQLAVDWFISHEGDAIA